MAKKKIIETSVKEEVSQTLDAIIKQSLTESCISLLNQIKDGKADLLNKDHVFEVTYNDFNDNYSLHVVQQGDDSGIIYLSGNLQFLPAVIIGFSLMYQLSKIDEAISHIQDSSCFSVLIPGSEELVEEGFEEELV